MDWTPVMVAELTRLWVDERWSGGRIAGALGTTKNAVVGKVRRLDLPRRASPIRQVLPAGSMDEIRRLRGAGAQRETIAAKLGVSVDYVRQLEVTHKLPRPQKPTLVPLRTIIEPMQPAAKPVMRPPRGELRKAGGCCWPLWGFREQPTHLYCGAVRPDSAQPYCAEHRVKAFVPYGRQVTASC